MDKIVEKTLLYDFYGELLTDHQREIYEDVVLNDYSISEVATDLGISRQGVHDQIRRVDKLLEKYESRLRLVEKFLQLRSQVEEIRRIVDQASAEELPEVKKSVHEIAGNILEEL